MMKGESTMVSNFGRNVNIKRQRLGLTQAQLAEKASIAQSAVSRIEAGDMNNPTLAIMTSLAKALHCDIPALLQ
jgi:transcriptional regulator with XRE-family HTH domain